MEHKLYLKKYLVISGILLLLLSGLTLGIQSYEYYVLRKSMNEKIATIVMELKVHYPELTDEEIMQILNHVSGEDISVKDGNTDVQEKISYESVNTNADGEMNYQDEYTVQEDAREYFRHYGIDLDRDDLIIENEHRFSMYLTVNLIVFILSAGSLITVFLLYNYRKDRAIADITHCIEEINRKNYSLTFDNVSEDELSLLQSEIYKTTIMLKETTEIAVNDKKMLKQSLEDISHQLKTPLTSILVMLDNLIDEPDMPAEVRDSFVRTIKREITNIHFLVQAILKMSKFDSNTMTFMKMKCPIQDLIAEAARNVETICDLKDVRIVVEEEDRKESRIPYSDGKEEDRLDKQREYQEERQDNPKEYRKDNQRDKKREENHQTDGISIVCDRRWQVEALTNILKNCVEHSEPHGEIRIEYGKNPVYSYIRTENYGDPIDPEDLPHIFERFYKGKNATPESIGIGLALAKTIVEEDNGMIEVDSDEMRTRFVIKYIA